MIRERDRAVVARENNVTTSEPNGQALPIRQTEQNFRLDEELADTFPASDPPSMTQPQRPEVAKER